MKVIKKDGRLDEFNLEKIIISILSATNSSKAMLNESDIKILAKDIEKIVVDIRGRNGETSSYELIGCIIEVLRRDGFSDVIEKYLSYDK